MGKVPKPILTPARDTPVTVSGLGDVCQEQPTCEADAEIKVSVKNNNKKQRTNLNHNITDVCTQMKDKLVSKLDGWMGFHCKARCNQHQ